MINPFIANDLRGHVSNVFGVVVSGTSAVVANAQAEAWKAELLFCISITVGLLTIIHLCLQIRTLAIALVAESTRSWFRKSK